MLPRFVWALLSGFGSSDLRVDKSLIKVAEVFVDAAGVHVGFGVIGFSSSDLRVEARA